MDNRFTLDLDSPTNISDFRGRIISFLKLNLSGAGKISSCILHFFNEGDDPADYAALKLVKPEFSAAQTLVPYQGSCLLIMDYSLCQITDVTGFIYSDDQITVTLTEQKFKLLT